MRDRQELAIARSVIYASLFDYPLTLDQLHESLIASTLTREQILARYDSSPRLRSIVSFQDGFFFPAGRRELIAERRRREARSRKFLRRHRRMLQIICALPFTRMVALSGSIAHLNLDEGGDLDLFIVTRGRRVWTVMVAAIVLTRLLRVRRVVCANFVMADTQLALAHDDLFTANQVLHLKPLLGSEVLEGFVAANPFVRRFYPNRRPARSDFLVDQPRWVRAVKSAAETLLAPALPAIEAICHRAYEWHLHRKSPSWRSPDAVRLDRDALKLHTQSHRRAVLARFEARVHDVEAALGRGEQAAIA